MGRPTSSGEGGGPMTDKKRVLVVEDDPSLTRVLRDNLLLEGYAVECVSTPDAARAKVREFAPALIILDVMLPGGSGFDLAEQLRLPGRTPFLFLTARTQTVDKLKGLALGADDYITKPFALDELLARVEVVLRRSRPAADDLMMGEVCVSFSRHRATRGGAPLRLTYREFQILRYLAERRGQVVPREELLRAIWGYVETPFTRSVDNAIARLRKKIEDNPRHPRFIQTAHGDGYCLVSEDPEPSEEI